MEFVLRFNLDKPDLSSFRRNHFRKYRNPRMFPLIMVIFAVVNGREIAKAVDEPKALINVATGTLIAVGVFLWFRYRLTREPKDADRNYGDYEYRISEDGIDYRNKFGDGHVRWDGIVRQDRSPNGWYLYVDPNRALIIPLRAFAQPEQEAAFAALVRSKVVKR